MVSGGALKLPSGSGRRRREGTEGDGSLGRGGREAQNAPETA